MAGSSSARWRSLSPRAAGASSLALPSDGGLVVRSLALAFSSRRWRLVAGASLGASRHRLALTLPGTFSAANVAQSGQIAAEDANAAENQKGCRPWSGPPERREALRGSTPAGTGVGRDYGDQWTGGGSMATSWARSLVATVLAAGVVLTASPAMAGGHQPPPPPPPATLTVAITSPAPDALFEAPASVTVTGTASITGGSTSWHRPKPTLEVLEISVDGGAARVLTKAEVDPDLPQASPATVAFSTVVPDLAIGRHQLCVTAKGTPAPAARCVSVEVVEDLVDCATAACVLSARDRNVSTAAFEGIGLTKLIGLRAGQWGPTDCGGLNCVTGYDALWRDDGGTGIAELKVSAVRTGEAATQTPAVFIDGVQVTAKCGTKGSPVPCVKITKYAGGCVDYFVRFASDPGIRFR
jgi:hypothetical protein